MINDLNSCIQIEETRINRRFSIPRQIVFRLNPDVLCQLEQIQQNNHQFTFRAHELADLRYYALLGSSLPEVSSFQLKQYLLPDSLTFATSYLGTNSPEKTVIRSIINLDGEITQQIQQDLWSNSQLLSRVMDIHHWLILQILAQLPLRKSDRLTKLIKSCWLITSISLSICLGFYLPQHIVLKILLAGLSFYILTRHLNKILKQKLKSWTLFCLVNGFWANSSRRRKFVWIVIAAFS